ncbi:protein CREG2-like [Oncorhynchus masou masou]|uniref:protein CREG2-like n=1 Tax=Oncorhynchus masou masou TaxID=90313 RepID=UPI003183181B
MYDPEDPRCARLTLTGKMVEVDPEEVEFAKEAMLSIHPVMKKWPVGHNWFVMKLQLTQVWLQDWVGGCHSPPWKTTSKPHPTERNFIHNVYEIYYTVSVTTHGTNTRLGVSFSVCTAAVITFITTNTT